jgi:iron(III) transport system substrate-binding protein
VVEVDGMTACKISPSLFLLLLISYSAANAQAVNLEAAKKEGRIVLYGTVVPQAMESIFNSFEKKYGIKVDYWRASANGVAERAVNEWRAGRPGFDVVEGNPGLNATLKKEGGFAKYIPPSSEKFASISKTRTAR